MTADTIQFVDAISSSPTVRLDINEQVSNWWTDFDPGSPRLRRASSANAMTDGIHVSSSSYDSRVLTFKSLLRDTTQDALATRFQALQRELDRPSNLIKYQPFGATKPVFFKTFRSDMSAIRVMKVSAATHELEFEVLAEPFALGLMETISVGTVNNDPAHATNGCYFDITAASVIGDVATPCVIMDTVVSTFYGYWARKATGTPSDMVMFYQFDTGWTLSSFSNPGGGPDASMSGTGTNNYIRSSAASASAFRTITGTDAERFARAGEWRVIVTARKSAGADVWELAMDPADGPVSTVTVEGGSNNRVLVDMGVMSFGGGVRAGDNFTTAPAPDFLIEFAATRVSGAGTLDLDCVQFLPATECLGLFSVSASASEYQVFDSTRESTYVTENAGTLAAGTMNVNAKGEVSGGFISLVPNQTNRIYWLRHDLTSLIVKADTSSLTVYYWPRYIFIRPSAT